MERQQESYRVVRNLLDAVVRYTGDDNASLVGCSEIDVVYSGAVADDHPTSTEKREAFPVELEAGSEEDRVGRSRSFEDFVRLESP